MKSFPPSHKWRILHFAWIAFCVSFVAWFAFPPIAVLAQEELRFDDQQLGWLYTAGLLLTVPGRIAVGWVVDRYGPRRAYTFILVGCSLPVVGLACAQSFWQLFICRLLIGVVGTGFVVGIRLISDWFPQRQLGLAEGIYGGWGNAGSAVAALVVPVMAHTLGWGWRLSSGLVAVPMLVWGAMFWRGVSDVPAGSVYRRQGKVERFKPLRDRRILLLAFAYFAAFGSEISVVAWLPKYFYDRFDLPLVGAGLLAALFASSNLFARPGGGWLADRWGGKPVLVVLTLGMALFYLLLGLAPSLPLAILSTAVVGLCVQGAEGAVFAAVPRVSRRNTGKVAGLVGAAGNLGGPFFALAFTYGLTASRGSYLPGFLTLAVTAALSATMLLLLLSLPTEAEADAVHGFRLATPGRRVRSRLRRPNLPLPLHTRGTR